jgi:hypothetical protein
MAKLKAIPGKIAAMGNRAAFGSSTLIVSWENVMATPFIQYRNPVGAGPSSNT